MSPGKRRKVRLTPMQGAVLRMLEEAGEENPPTVLNTLRAAHADQSNEEFAQAVRLALGGLYDLGFITLSRDEERPNQRWMPVPPEDIPRILSISQVVRWDDRGYWRWDDCQAGPYRASLALTEAGRWALSA